MAGGGGGTDEGMPEGVRPLVSLPQEVQAEHLLRVEQDGSCRTTTSVL